MKTESIEIQPTGKIVGRIQPPGSKSITNRALICAALADGTSTLTGVLDSVDTRVMVRALETLGITIDAQWEQQRLIVAGQAGQVPSPSGDLFLENSGTSIRFLTALCALGTGPYRLDGTKRMRERPIGDLLNTLNQMGAICESENKNDCPPLQVKSKDSGGGIQGGEISIRGSLSSQFLSAIMMASPCATEEVRIKIEGELVSRPYVEMTAAVMSRFGARSEILASGQVVIPTGSYRGLTFSVEPDASAASYFWAAAAITGGDVTVVGLSERSLQGDIGFCECLRLMGCDVEYGSDFIRVRGGELVGIDVEMGEISDTVQTIAAVALFAKGPTTVRGIAHNRHKETDRIGDLATELRKLGAEVEEFDDGLKISPAALHGATIETYDDHRMAMSLSLVGLRVSGVRILDPGCTAKTYPRFFEDLAALTGQARQ